MTPAMEREISCPKNYEETLRYDTDLIELFCLQARLNPQKTAIVHGSTYLTYAALHRAVQCLASQICRRHLISKEQLVGILIPRGCQHVIAQAAILYLGATCVPLDPDFPDTVIAERLTAAKIDLVLVDSTTLPRIVDSTALNIEESGSSAASYNGSDSEDEVALEDASIAPRKTGMGHRSHLLFTSGTTGAPKAVEIVTKSIIHVAFNVHDAPLPSDAVVGHPSQITFDISMFDIWAPLTRGATIAVVDKQTLLDSFALAKTIEEFGISVMLITVAAVNLAAATNPRAFSKLDMLLFGGEALNQETVSSILEAGPPKRLITVYGPTECCIFSLTHELTLDNLPKTATSVGRPIGRTGTYILDESLRPVAKGEIGEMCIAGDGLSRGYHGQEARTKQTFTYFASSSGPTSMNGDLTRIYRTGDFVKEAPDGSVEFIGRCDHQVKIRGHRIELSAVERALLATGHVAAAAALKFEPEGESWAAVLVAFVELKKGFSTSAEDLVAILQREMPSYMVPEISLVDKMPLSSHVKIDRAALKKHAASLRRARVDAVCYDHDNEDSTMTKIRRFWTTTLTIAKFDVQPEDDFFALGGTSIQAAILLHKLRTAFTTNVYMRDVYENPRLADMVALVETRQGGEPASRVDETITWKADSTMADEISFPADTDVPDWTAEEEGRVFVTGATGFVGVHLVADLLDMSEVQTVACLIRAKTEQEGLDRLKGLMQRYQLWRDDVASKIQVLCGDIQNEFLGLGQAEFSRLGSWSSTIFHLAARVNYIEPYSSHQSANVVGTYNIIRLATTGRLKSLHYSSSIAAFGPTGLVNACKIVREDDDPDKHLPALPFDQGYAQSQWVVDKMMTRCIARGIPAAIYRPGFVIGSTKTGVNNRDDFLSRLVDGCFATGSYPYLPRQGKEFVTVDYVCRTMLMIARKRENLSQAYHLTPPDASLSLTLTDFFVLLQSSRPDLPRLKQLPYQQWLRETIDGGSERLAPLLPMLQERVSGDRTRWEMYENMPVYDTSNTKQAVAAAGVELDYPIVDRKLVCFYLDQSYPPN